MAVLGAIVFWVVVGLPFAITGLAFLDVARRPSWAWAAAGRRQVLWLAVLGGAAITWLGGAAVGLWYFASAARDVRDAEQGDLRFWSDEEPGPDADQPPES